MVGETWFKRFKVLPLLIVLATAAFSVRAIEVAGGVRAMMQGAVAAEEEKKEQAEGEKLALPEEVKAKDPVVAENVAGEARPSGATGMFEEEEVTGAEDDMEQEIQEAESKKTRDPNKPKTKWVDSTDSDMEYEDVKIEMFRDLAERRAFLEEKESELATREALLSAAEKELDRKYQELSVIREQIEELLGKQSEEEKARVGSLVKIYEGMKAKDAANIFNTLDLEVLVMVMSQMSERKLSPVLAAMNAERARTVTIMLAEQKQLPVLPGQ